MADDKESPLYKNPTSPSKRWKKGDRRTINGREYESQGTGEEQSEEDLKKPPTLLKDKHFWTPVPDEAVPTS